MMNMGRQKKISIREKAVRTNANGKIPYGREAVKKAILDATEKLLLKKSPNKISVREIAEAANIKHPLIHRHFGTKDEVVMAVHARNIEKVERKIAKVENLEGNIATFFEAVKKNKFRQIALSRAMIDGINPRVIQNQFPVMQRLLELLKKRRSESELKFDSEMMTAILGATVLGWFLYEPFLLAATNLEDKNKDEIHQKVTEIIEEIIQKLC
jgi:TetR/AcrR family transcriptional regulator, repressor for neighboring sulfatase